MVANGRMDDPALNVGDLMMVVNGLISNHEGNVPRNGWNGRSIRGIGPAHWLHDCVFIRMDHVMWPISDCNRLRCETAGTCSE